MPDSVLADVWATNHIWAIDHLGTFGLHDSDVWSTYRLSSPRTYRP